MKIVENFENYTIDESGNVFNKKDKLKHTFLNEHGYVLVVLFKNNKQKALRISRLVATAYIPNPSSLPEVNHIDGNKQNNHKDNLEWSTISHNRKHAWSIGLNKGNTH